jgi:hypothetical protein
LARVLYRVSDKIRYDLAEPVRVPLALQISDGLQSHDCVRLTKADFDYRLAWR